MISIFEAIKSGAWFQVQYPPSYEDEEEANGGLDVIFKLRLTEFSKIDIKSIDKYERLSRDVDSNIWKLQFDIVNLCKKGEPIYGVLKNLRLFDADGYEFEKFDDDHLRLSSDYADSSGMSGFYSGNLPPKVRRKGVIPFELPDEFDNMFLKFNNGSIKALGEMYRYFHDEKSSHLYRCRSEPHVSEVLYRNKQVAWKIRLEVDVTRSDNWLDSPNQWHFPRFEVHSQEFDLPRYTRENAISSFLTRALPLSRGAVEIDAQTYEEIESKYESVALKNKMPRDY